MIATWQRDWSLWSAKNPIFSYCRFLFLGHPPKKKPAKKKHQKKRPPKNNTTTPWPLHIPKESRQKMPFPGNPGKMHDEVKREYAADEKMASSQPWELRFCGDFMPFWKPKKTGSAYPPNIPSSETRIEYWRSLIKRETNAYISNVCCVLVIWTWGIDDVVLLEPPVEKNTEMCFWEQIREFHVVFFLF